MKDKKGKILKYTNRKHIRKTKRIKYQNLLQNYRNKNNISEIENELKNYNSKTCNLEKFKTYILGAYLLVKFQKYILFKLYFCC
jgi:hypothetical protein